MPHVKNEDLFFEETPIFGKMPTFSKNYFHKTSACWKTH